MLLTRIETNARNTRITLKQGDGRQTMKKFSEDRNFESAIHYIGFEGNQ